MPTISSLPTANTVTDADEFLIARNGHNYWVPGSVFTALANSIANLQSNIGNVASDGGVASNAVTALQGNVTLLQSNVGLLQGNVAGLQTNVAGLQTNVAGLQANSLALLSNVTLLQANAVSQESEILALQTGKVSSVTITGSTDIAVTGGGTTTAPSFALALKPTGVMTGSYNFPTISVDSYGRITAITNRTAVTSVALTSNTLAVANTAVTSAGSIAVNLANVSVQAGDYQVPTLTVDGYGRVVAISNGAINAGSVTSVGLVQTGSAFTISNSPITSAGNITIDLANSGVTPGTYTVATITVDATGRVTAAQNGTGGTTSSPYDIAAFINSKPLGTELVFQWVAPRAVVFQANLGGSQAIANTAATASAVFSLQQNGTVIGSLTFAANAVTGTFTTSGAVNFATGDVLRVYAPSSQDLTLADISMTFAGTR